MKKIEPGILSLMVLMSFFAGRNIALGHDLFGYGEMTVSLALGILILMRSP